jgi:hypothetical protein
MIDNAARRAGIIDALTATKGQSMEEMASAVEAALMPQPTQDVADLLWKVVVFTLAIIAGLALIGLVVLLAISKTPDLILTAFTASVTGLLGLFVKSPVQG